MLDIILYLVGLAAAVWVIYDVWVNNRGATTVMKVVWTVAALIFSIITAIVYYFVRK